MRRVSLSWVRQVLARKGTAKAFAAVLCVSLVLPPQFGVAAELAHTRSLRGVRLNSVNTLIATSTPAIPFKTRLKTWLATLLPLQRVLEIPPVAPAPGLPPAWGASAGVYGGVVNLGNGNLCLQLPLVGWANGVSLSLVFNSQANPSQPSPIAPKWTHSWHVFLTLNSSQTQATLQEGDGSRWVYNDPDGDGVFTPPTGVFDRSTSKSPAIPHDDAVRSPKTQGVCYHYRLAYAILPKDGTLSAIQVVDIWRQGSFSRVEKKGRACFPSYTLTLGVGGDPRRAKACL